MLHDLANSMSAILSTLTSQFAKAVEVADLAGGGVCRGWWRYVGDDGGVCRGVPAVHRNTEQQPIEAPTQVELPAVPTVAAEEPPPRRYPARIRRPPDRL